MNSFVVFFHHFCNALAVEKIVMYVNECNILLINLRMFMLQTGVGYCLRSFNLDNRILQEFLL